MVFVKIQGGLGNQMFQYALGQALKNRYQVPVRYDVSWFISDQAQCTHRKLELVDFNVDMIEFSSYENLKMVKLWKSRYIHVPKHGLAKLCREESPYYFSHKLKKRRTGYFEGYFQSEKYFLSFRKDLLLSFTLRESLECEADLSKCVAIHIRRGDYVSSQSASEYHGNLSIEYYVNALDAMAEKVSIHRVAVFSDDIDWVKKHIHFKYDTIYLEPRSASSASEMLRMSRCAHFIIANSSFSWWAAWLSVTSPHKVVIAPRQWTSFHNVIEDNLDVIPSEWLLQ